MKLWIFTIVFLFLVHQEEVFGWWSRRRRRRRAPPPCTPVGCIISWEGWNRWSVCTHQCGNAGVQSRTRTKSQGESCGGTCPYHLSETRACNRDACQHGGTPISGSCRCTTAWTGTCCQNGL